MTWLKTAQYPFNPLEGCKEGETAAELKEKALQAINADLPVELRCISALQDWDSEGEGPVLVFERVLCQAPAKGD